jgi:hypothetical protein
MAKKIIIGACQICGEEKQLTVEHYIPRAAGGGASATIYSGDELLKSLQTDDDGKPLKPKGKLQQNGMVKHTLCKECNERSGTLYDKEFSRFYKGLHYVLMNSISIPKGQTIEEFLEGQIVDITIPEIKLLNIAKRILVSFCSVEYPGLTNRQLEIRKAIMDKDYIPDTSGFALFMSLHLGNSAFFGTMAALKGINDQLITQVFAGIESDFLAFYFTTDKNTKAMGLENCTDITEWLTKYKYDQPVDVKLELMFNKSLMIRFPIGNNQ